MSPGLDEWNRAETGHRFDIPVLVQRPVGAAESPVRTFTTEVSYDEGRTWEKVALKPSWRGASWSGELRIPSGAASVSLRAGASDDRGGTVTQELIRALGVK